MTLRLFLVFFLGVSFQVAQARADEPLAKKVLVIGIDGCRPDALKAAKTTHLAEMMRDGAFSDAAQTGDMTISGPGWSSMLTGVWRQKHGVRDNSFKGSNYREFPHFFHRLKEARPTAVTASICHWEPINKFIISGCDTVASFKTGKEVAEKSAAVLAEPKLDAIFVHFDDVDHAGHKDGFSPKLPSYLKAIEEVDILVGDLLKAMRGRKTYPQEDWLVLVSTDHGGSEKSHGKDIPQHRTIFVIVHGKSAVRGTIDPAPGVVDVAATALVHLGVPIDPKWQWDGKAVGLKAAVKQASN